MLYDPTSDRSWSSFSFPNYFWMVAAFALSSGTIGAALSSSLSRIRSIAISYGTVQNPVPESLYEPAHTLAVRIVRRLVDEWGADEVGIRNGEIDLYNINIPMVNALLDQESLPVIWTTIWRNSYARLFKPHTLVPPGSVTPAPAGGPDATTERNSRPRQDNPEKSGLDPQEVHSAPELVFTFAPNMEGLIGPNILAPVGSDAWAVENGMASVTPLRASFAEPPHPTTGDGGQTPRPFKL